MVTTESIEILFEKWSARMDALTNMLYWEEVDVML